MSLAAVLQLYAPLAGLILMAFWTGVLHQRVAQLEAVARELRSQEEGRDSVIDRLARLEVKSDNTTKQLDKIARELEGVQRQLSDLARTRPAAPPTRARP